MKEESKIASLSEEQLKALCDPIRIRIAHLLKTPRTPKQVSDIINVRPNNLYYHFRILEKAEIIEQVETVSGKGFIKEHFYKLKADDIEIVPQNVRLSERMRFLQNLIRAAMEDLGGSIEKYDRVVGLGKRDDFAIPEEKLERAREIILARKNKAVAELQALHNPEGECNYQLNIFCFKL